jgi:hypothetical protein
MSPEDYRAGIEKLNLTFSVFCRILGGIQESDGNKTFQGRVFSPVLA